MLLLPNKKLFKKMSVISITVDIDCTAHLIIGHQQGAEKGYCPHKLGNRCFQSATVICDESETDIAEKTMSGEKHCSHGIIDFLKPLLEPLSRQLHAIKVRFDVGFFSTDLLTFLESYPNVTYEIGAPQHEWLRRKIRQLKYHNYYDSQRQYSSFAHGEGRDGAFRYYSVERSEEQDSEQLDLFETDKYTNLVVISNRQRRPNVIFNSYNKRERIEKYIEELKNQYALGKLVSGSFMITKSFCWLSQLAFTILGMLRQAEFRKRMKHFRLRRLRFILFSTIAWFFEHVRQKTFKIARLESGRFNSMR